MVRAIEETGGIFNGIPLMRTLRLRWHYQVYRGDSSQCAYGQNARVIKLANLACALTTWGQDETRYMSAAVFRYSESTVELAKEERRVGVR